MPYHIPSFAILPQRQHRLQFGHPFVQIVPWLGRHQNLRPVVVVVGDCQKRMISFQIEPTFVVVLPKFVLVLLDPKPPKYPHQFVVPVGVVAWHACWNNDRDHVVRGAW